jgi:tRNA(Ile)-lysidine synthase
MQPVSPLPGAPGLLLLRPLLEVSRDEIETYCRQRHLEPLEDSSNQDMTFLRNRLRRELLPLLATYNPQIKTHLQQMAAVVAADVALLDQWLQEHWPAILVESGPGWLSLDRAAWRLLPLSLRRRSLRRALAQLWPALPAELSLPGGPSLPDIAFRPIEQARTVGEQGRVGAQAALPGGLLFTVGYDHLTIAAGQALPPLNQPQLLVATPLPLPVPGRVALAGSWSIEATLLPEIDLQQIEQNQDPWLAFVDIGAAGASPLQLRPRRPGERFQPLGLQGQSASLKEVMINRQIPAALRARWPLVTMPEHVVWLVGHHIDERVRVTAASRRVIQLRCWADQINVY